MYEKPDGTQTDDYREWLISRIDGDTDAMSDEELECEIAEVEAQDEDEQI